MPYYDGLTDVDKLLDAFEREVLEKHCFQTLDWALRATPTRWWGMHKDNFDDCPVYKKMMRVQFGHPQVWLTKKYDRRNDPCNHLAK